MTIQGFEKRKSEDDIDSCKMPEVLKEFKEKLSSEVEEGTKDLKEIEKINMFEQLIDGKVDCSKILE